MLRQSSNIIFVTLIMFALAVGVSVNWISAEAAPTSAFRTVPVYLPEIIVAPGEVITIPVTVGDTTGAGINSYQFSLIFDPTVLQPVAPPVDMAGTMTSLPSWSAVGNPNFAGNVPVAAFTGAAPLEGAGTLINLKFTVVGSHGQSSKLSFDRPEPPLPPGPFLQFGFGGTAVPETNNGKVTVSAGRIAGAVTYGNAIGEPTTRFVSDTLVCSSTGSPSVLDMSDALGQYSISGFGTGAYSIVATKSGGVNGISSFDAALIAKHVAGSISLSENQLIVADVSNNGAITSFDAGQVARYVAGSPPFGFTGTWKMLPSIRHYPAVTSSIAGEDFSALLMGEVSGNWTNSGSRSAKE